MMAKEKKDCYLPLLDGLLKGDPAAEGEFFGLAYRFLTSASWNFPQIEPKDREDFVMEVIERALNRLELFCPAKGSFRGWLFIMAKHLAYDRGRRQRDQYDVMYGALNEEVLEWELPVARGTTPTNSRLPTTDLDAVLGDLKPEDRTLVEMSAYGSCSRMIGEEINISPENVRQRRGRIFRRLRKQLDQRTV